MNGRAAVLHVTHQSWPYVRGGVERLSQVLQATRSIGLVPIVVSSPFQAPAGNPFADEEVCPDGIRHVRTNTSTSAKGSWGASRSLLERVKRALVLPVFAFRVIRVALAERPIAIHAHQTFVELFASYIAAKVIGVPLIYEVRSAWELDMKGRLHQVQRGLAYTLERLATVCADHVVVLCKGLADHYRVSAHDTTIIYNTASVADSEELGQVSRRDQLHLVYAGALAEYEGLGFLLEALVERPSVALTIVGSGNHVSLIQQCVQLGLSERVRILEPMSRARVHDLIGRSDAVILPRLKSPLTDMVVGLKPIECLALGAIAIASDVGGHKEVLSDGENSIIFVAGSKQSLIHAIDRRVLLSAAESQVMRRNAKTAFGERFSKSAFVSCYANAYRRAGVKDVAT